MNEGYIKLTRAIFGFKPITIPPYEMFEIIDEEKFIRACDDALSLLDENEKKAVCDIIFEDKELSDSNKEAFSNGMKALRRPNNSKEINRCIKKVEY